MKFCNIIPTCTAQQTEAHKGQELPGSLWKPAVWWDEILGPIIVQNTRLLFRFEKSKSSEPENL